MSRSSLSSMVLTGKGVEMGRLVSYSGALSGLASSSSSESAGRITSLGASPTESPSTTGTTTTGSLSGLNLQTDGCWVTDQNLKMIKLKMHVFQQFPLNTPEGKYTMVTDNGCNEETKKGQLRLSVGDGTCSVPSNFNERQLTVVQQQLGGEDKNFKIGCAFGAQGLGYQYLQRYFPDPMINWKKGDMEKLLQNGCLVVEAAFPSSGGDAKTIFIKCVDICNPYEQVLDVMGCLFSLKEFKETGIKINAFNEKNECVEIFNEKYDFPLSNSSYDYLNGEISGYSVKKLREMGKNSTTAKSTFSKFSTNPDTSLYCRFFIPTQFRDKAEKALGHKIPDAFTKYNGTVSISSSLSSVDTSGEISGTFEELRRKYRALTPSCSGQQIVYVKNDSLRRNYNCETTFVEVPWPCFVRKRITYGIEEVENGNYGLAELSSSPNDIENRDGTNAKLLARSYSKSQYEEIWTKYEQNGKVKIKMNSAIADRVQNFFNDMYKFYGHDIIITCPSFCAITALSNGHNPESSASAHWARCAIDFNCANELNDTTLNKSDIGTYKNDSYKGALKIAAWHGTSCGVNSSSFYYNKKKGQYEYDPMHFQWA